MNLPTACDLVGAPVDHARDIRLLLVDVDGVLTDGRLFVGEQGQEYKAFHARDGHGLRMLMATGVEVGIISGRDSAAVRHRASDLGIRHVIQGCNDKRAAALALLAHCRLKAIASAFIGDDVIDLPVMAIVGLAVAVADAHPLVIAMSRWTTRAGGGQGAVRELCELIMYAQGTLEAQLQEQGTQCG